MISPARFFEKFPHVFPLPQQPQCLNCWGVFQFNLNQSDGAEVLEMIETHNPGCPLFDERNGKAFVVDARRKPDNEGGQ